MERFLAGKQFRKSSGSSACSWGYLRKIRLRHTLAMSASPRARKCIYCRHSKLTDECFLVVMFAFINGLSAEETAQSIKERGQALIGMKGPSEKTIRRYFHLIGTRLFEDYAEPWMLRGRPKLAALKREARHEYDEKIERCLLEFHKEFIGGNVGLSHELPDAMAMYRRMSANKFGVRAGLKQNFGLAFFHQKVVDAGKPQFVRELGYAEFIKNGAAAVAYGSVQTLMEKFRENPL